MSHRVKPGDTVLPAKAMNDSFRAAEIVLSQGKQPRRAGSGALVRNSSGSAVDRFGVLGVSGPLVAPADNLNAYQGRLAVDGVTPLEANHWGAFVVCLEPIPAGGIGRAVASGLVQVQIDMKHADHLYADILNSDATKLQSSVYGSSRIVAVESGTGAKWAIVSLQSAQTGSFGVKLTQTGGSAGGDSTQCSYTYTVNDMHGNQLATGVNPTASPHLWQRPDAGLMKAATAGVATMETGELVILTVNEMVNFEACS